MKPLLTGAYCPRDCDRKPPPEEKTPWVVPSELRRWNYVAGRSGVIYGIYYVEPPAKKWMNTVKGATYVYASHLTKTGYADIAHMADFVRNAQTYWNGAAGTDIPDIGVGVVARNTAVTKDMIVFIPEG